MSPLATLAMGPSVEHMGISTVRIRTFLNNHVRYTHATSPTQPRSRQPVGDGPIGDDATHPSILVLLDRTRGGKGLKAFMYHILTQPAVRIHRSHLQLHTSAWQTVCARLSGGRMPIFRDVTRGTTSISLYRVHVRQSQTCENHHRGPSRHEETRMDLTDFFQAHSSR